MKIKFLAVMIAFLVMGVAAFWGWVISTCGSLTTIPHYALTMWIFEAVFVILILLILAGIFLVASALNGEEDEQPKRKRNHKAMKAVEPEKKLRVRKPRKPESRKKPEKSVKDVGAPAEWKEEEFE